MEKSRIDQILQYGRVAAVPVFLFYKNSIKALNEQAESIGLTKEELISFPKEKDVVTGWMLETGDGETEQFYKIYARHILLEDGDCWLIETIREDNQMKLLEISRISKARKIMFEMSSKIDSIETNHDIYDFILDNCGKAVEYSDMCSLMRIDNGMAHVVAKRGYSDAIYQMYIQKNETFIGLETNGKLDHSIMINDLEKYYTFYNRDVLAEERGFSLKSTLATPIRVNGELFAILCFDSIEKDAFTEMDEELLDLIKADIEVILTNHFMHMEISRLSKTDNLTGLYNRSYLQDYLRKNYDLEFYVGMFDMDDLKGTNDHHGHGSGDIMLKAMSNELINAFPCKSLFFRIGGDEFLGILFDMKLDEIEKTIKKLKNDLQDRTFTLEDGTEKKLSFSCGFACHHKGDHFHDIMKIADNYMYEEKKKMKTEKAEK
jgi:diguanylate cyclase (GGDEF)-like protein